MAHPVTFIICTERGPLERMSLLLIESIRRFGGTLCDAPIYSYAPRRGRGVTRATRRQMERLGVDQREMVLNREFEHYAWANKIFAAEHAERTADSDALVFLDSDKIVLADPQLLRLDGVDAAARPVDFRKIGTSDERDENWAYWQEINRVCGVRVVPYSRSVVDGERMQSYWQGGLLAVRRSRGIFSRWLSNFHTIMRAGIAPPSGFAFVEQSTFGTTVAGLGLEVFELPATYNYSVHIHDRLPQAIRAERLSDLVTIHYHHMFEWGTKTARPHPLTPLLGDDEQSRWVVESLDRTGVYHHSSLARLGLHWAQKVSRRVNAARQQLAGMPAER